MMAIPAYSIDQLAKILYLSDPMMAIAEGISLTAGAWPRTDPHNPVHLSFQAGLDRLWWYPCTIVARSSALAVDNMMPGC